MTTDTDTARNTAASSAASATAAAASVTAPVRLPHIHQQQQQQPHQPASSESTTNNNTTTTSTVANPSSGNASGGTTATTTIGQPQQGQPPHQHLHQHHSGSISQHHHSTKTDEIEILESAGDEQLADKFSTGWICCAPCIWLRTSAAVHKIAITTATLLVTSLLVASPVLFLLSTAPSQLPRECNSKHDMDCVPIKPPAPECELVECQTAAMNLLARMNWQLDACNVFRDFSYSSAEGSLKEVHSAQEDVDLQMLHLLTHNTTTGTYRKLGRLYGSCLRQTTNATSIRLSLDALGGYLPIGSLGPSSISPLMSAIHRIGPTPLVSIYYDLSYGKQPQIMLVVDGANPAAPALQMVQRWMRPKAPPHAPAAHDFDGSVDAMLNDVLGSFLSAGLSAAQRASERATIDTFMRELRVLRQETLRGDFADSYVMYNVSTLSTMFTFLNWSELVVPNWTGPILLRSADYLKGLQHILERTQRRVVHNAMLVMFALSILPPGRPDALVCARATMWAMPEASSALYASQFSDYSVRERNARTEVIFEVLKAWLKRAPSLKGAALVKLSQLRVQTALWPALGNLTAVTGILSEVQISSDNWFDNVLEIYRTRRPDLASFGQVDQMDNNSTAWSYPTISRAFYDPLSHSILIPLSVVQTTYFHAKLPPYMHYAGVGAAIATEILRSITKQFEDKLLQCVPPAVNIITNTSRMDILCQSGGMQIAYHSMLSLTGPLKGMLRLPGINMSPTQLFYLVYGQTTCAMYDYAGVRVTSDDFAEILSWLIAQGGSATQVFQCSYYSVINQQKSCNVL